MNKLCKAILFTAIVGFTISGCKGKKKSSTAPIIRESANIESLNPVNATDASARPLTDYCIFLNLLGQDPSTYEMVPQIAKSMPVVTDITEGPYKGGVTLQYEIREEAVWDNGTPVTADDYIFTLKAIINPKTNCEHLKPYYDWLVDVEKDSTNPKKITVIAKEKYFMIQEFSGGYVLPEYIYDPNQLMRKVPLADLADAKKREVLKGNADVLKFADDFNSEKYSRDAQYVVGCGAYKLSKWETGQYVELIKKKNWWGDKLKDNRQFYAFPEKLVFKIIPDENTAMTALKGKQIDAFERVKAKEFKELEKNKSVTEAFNLIRNATFAYSYIGFNLRNEKLKDIKVREAFAHCVDKKKINEAISMGEAVPTESMVHPLQKHNNTDLKPWGYDIAKANTLLDEAGWKDTDGDGIRDKVLNGKKTKLSFEVKFPSSSEPAKEQSLIIKEDLKKAGIEFTLAPKEWTVLIQEMDKHDFEINLGSWTIPATMSDPKQTWHTASAVVGGSNHLGFGNAETDKLIMEIRAEMDLQKRGELYKKFQQIVHDQIPCVFMFNPINRLAISKKYKVETTAITPGFRANEFKIAE